MSISFEEWKAKQEGVTMCRVLSTMNCFPLSKDPLCKACYRDDTQAENAPPPGDDS